MFAKESSVKHELSQPRLLAHGGCIEARSRPDLFYFTLWPALQRNRVKKDKGEGHPTLMQCFPALLPRPPHTQISGLNLAIPGSDTAMSELVATILRDVVHHRVEHVVWHMLQHQLNTSLLAL